MKPLDELKIIYEILKNKNLIYWLDFGCLLKWYRDQELDKSDIDFGIMLSDYDKLKIIIEENNSLFEMTHFRDKEISLRLNGVKFDFICFDIKKEDIYFYAYKQNPYCNNKWNYEWRGKFPLNVYFPLNTIDIYDMTFNTPNNIEEKIKLQYGEDWKIPKPEISCWTYELNQVKDVNYKPVAVVMTTIARDEILMKVLPSYINQPIKLYLLDQGAHSIDKDAYYDNLRSMGHFIEYSEEIGLSGARNYLLDHVTEEYVFMSEDDIELQMNPCSLFNKFTGNNLGILGGLLIRNGKEQHYEYELNLHDGTLDYLKSGNIDLCLNFFLAKRRVFDNLRYDNELKLCEHSVTKNTAIIIKDGWNNIKSIPICKLFPKSIDKNRYLFDESCKIEVWTDKGWQKIKGIFKHKINEPIYKILTNHGYVECTKDHSLIISNTQIKPSSLKIGDNIELCQYPKLSNKLSVNKNWAWLLGLFLAEGHYNKENRDCNIANQKNDILYKAKSILQEFGIDSHLVNNIQNKSRCNYLKFKPFALADSYFSSFYIEKEKIIPSFVYNFNREGRIMFFEGFFSGDGTKSNKKHKNSRIFSQKSQCIINGLWYLMHDIYENRNLNTDKNKYGNWFVSNFKKYKTKNSKKIKKIEIINLDDFVYDIETENHHFCGGVGNVNLHNTDFFLALKKLGKWKVSYSRDLIGIHHTFKPTNYMTYRGRAVDYAELFKTKWGISKINKDIDPANIQDNLTVFVLTHDNEPNYTKCIEALNNQTIKFTLEIIANVHPMSAAFQEMLNRCYDKETEILTNNGWKYFKDLNGDELVANLSQKTRNVIYSPIKKKIKYKYNGKLHHYSSKTTDLLVTPNHNLWGELISLNYSKSFGINFIESQKLTRATHLRVPLVYKNKKKLIRKYIEIKNINIGRNKNKKYIYNFKLWAELLGWYISEGHLLKRNGSYRGFSITQKKYTKEIEVLLSKLKIHYQKVCSLKVQDCFEYRIINKSLAYHILQKCGQKNTKCIPTYIKNTTPDIIQAFLNSYILGDGNRRKEIISISTCVSQLANDLSEIAIKSEKYWASIQIHKGRPCYATKNKIYQSKDIYCVLLTNRTKFNLLNIRRRKEIDYNDFVYCVETKTGIILTKRRGKILWCGNCTTPYYIQIDSDMILNSNGIEKLYNSILNTQSKTAMVCFKLLDHHQNKPIDGIKIYKYDIFKKYPYKNVLSCEMEQLKELERDGFNYIRNSETIGTHCPIWSKETIFERYFNYMEKLKKFESANYPLLLQNLLNIFLKDQTKTNLYAFIGAIASAVTRDIKTDEKDYTTPLLNKFNLIDKSFDNFNFSNENHLINPQIDNKILVLQLAGIPCANRPYNINKIINEYSKKYKSRHVLGNQYSKSHTDIPYREFPYDLLMKKDKNEIIELIQEAKIIHIHHNIDNHLLSLIPKTTKIIYTVSNLGSSKKLNNIPENIKYEERIKNIANIITVTDQPLQKIGYDYLTNKTLPLVIDFKYKQTIKNNKTPIIAFSPTNRRLDDVTSKGYYRVLGIIYKLRLEGYEFDFDLIEGVPYEENLKRKSMADIIIDDVINEEFHNTSCEGGCFGAAVLTNYNDNMYPFIKTSLNELENTLKKLISNPELLNKEKQKMLEWSQSIYTPENLLIPFENIYDEVLSSDYSKKESEIIENKLNPIEIITLLKNNNIKFYLSKISCLEAINNKNLNNETLTIGVFDELEKNNIKNIYNHNNLIITDIKKIDLKDIHVNNLGIKVPFPVIKYLENLYGPDWKNSQ